MRQIDPDTSATWIGVPHLKDVTSSPYWRELPSIRPLLFESAGRPGYSQLKLPSEGLKDALCAAGRCPAFSPHMPSLMSGAP